MHDQRDLGVGVLSLDVLVDGLDEGGDAVGPAGNAVVRPAGELEVGKSPGNKSENLGIASFKHAILLLSRKPCLLFPAAALTPDLQLPDDKLAAHFVLFLFLQGDSEFSKVNVIAIIRKVLRATLSRAESVVIGRLVITCL